jgi:hypothetical protein
MLAPEIRDYFSEMYVAARLADRGWNVYLPRRDKGFDFIITKEIEEQVLIRPVQVKGLYPTRDKKDRSAFGYTGRLTGLHDDMILAIAFFERAERERPPAHVAFMPRSAIRPRERGGWRCVPAELAEGGPKPRRDSARFFDSAGMQAIESPEWR